MINFMMKHPIVTYLIVDRIAVMVERVCEGRAGSPMIDEVVEVVSEKGRELKRKHKESEEEKEPMGFHFSKEVEEEPKYSVPIYDEASGRWFISNKESIEKIRERFADIEPDPDMELVDDFYKCLGL